MKQSDKVKLGPPAPIPGNGGGDQVKTILDLSPEQRANQCWRDIQKVLASYDYEIVPVPGLSTEGRVIASLRLQPRAPVQG